MNSSADATAAASRGEGSHVWGSAPVGHQRLHAESGRRPPPDDVREERLGGDDPGSPAGWAARARGQRDRTASTPRRAVSRRLPGRRRGFSRRPRRCPRRQSGQSPVSSSQWLCTVKPVCARADRASVPMAHPENSTVRRQRSQVTWWPWAVRWPARGEDGAGMKDEQPSGWWRRSTRPRDRRRSRVR